MPGRPPRVRRHLAVTAVALVACGPPAPVRPAPTATATPAATTAPPATATPPAPPATAAPAATTAPPATPSTTADATPAAPAAPPDVAGPPADAERSASGLAWKVLAPGNGLDRPRREDRAVVHFTGWTTDGVAFDSSHKRGTPATFGLRHVIPGWTEGLQLMTLGETRRLWIPEALAYKGRPGKPAGMLVFDVELLDILPGPPPIPAPAGVAAPPRGATREPSGLAWKRTRKGTGKARPSARATATFHFTAWQRDGVMIQSSRQVRGRPVRIPIEKGIPAWQEVLPQMTVGETRVLWVPAGLGLDTPPGAPTEGTTMELELLAFVEPPPVPADVAAVPADATIEPSGLAWKGLAPGRGTVHPTAADRVEVHYSGWTSDGKLLDSSTLQDRPLRFALDGVIPGWTEGLQLMVVGEKRRFWVPEALAYQGHADAPRGTLVFDIELLAINPPERPPAPAPPPPPPSPSIRECRDDLARAESRLASVTELLGRTLPPAEQQELRQERDALAAERERLRRCVQR